MCIRDSLMNAQGEDVVAGVRTPQTIDQLKAENPAVYQQFYDIVYKLENHYKDMQDMEFTIEDGKLYMLQTRNGKRTAAAALKIACDLVDEGKMCIRDRSIIHQIQSVPYLNLLIKVDICDQKYDGLRPRRSKNR